jgi:hypothetical protein
MPNPVKLNAFRCFFVHNCMMDVFSGITQWFTQSYFTEFNTVCMGGYDRAIREIQEDLSIQNEAEKALKPALSIQPIGDLTTDEKFAQLWRLQEIGTNLHDLYLEPLYEDDYFGFNVVANRLRGNFEVIIYLTSPYEYLDHYIQSLMFFHGGFNRRVRCGMVQTHALIPDEVLAGAYADAPYDWSQTDLTTHFNNVINREYSYFPMELGPQIWLSSISNASTVYGEDALGTYKIQLVCEYDIDVPTHIIVKANDKIQTLNMKITTNDPIFIPNVPRYSDSATQIVIDDLNLKDVPRDALGPDKYFKELKMQEYHAYMFGPDRMIRGCSSGTTLVHHATINFIFDEDVNGEDGYTIDISQAGMPIDYYDKIIIGDRTGVLTYGKSYEVDLEDTGTIVTVKTDVTKDTIWDILLYKEGGLDG